jgi:hypothetical protein
MLAGLSSVFDFVSKKTNINGKLARNKACGKSRNG